MCADLTPISVSADKKRVAVSPIDQSDIKKSRIQLAGSEGSIRHPLWQIQS